MDSLSSLEGPHKWWTPQPQHFPFLIDHYKYKLADMDREVQNHLVYMYPEYIADLMNILYIHATKDKRLPEDYLAVLKNVTCRLQTEQICAPEYIDVIKYIISVLEFMIGSRDDVDVTQLEDQFSSFCNANSGQAFFLCIKQYFLANVNKSMDEQVDIVRQV